MSRLYKKYKEEVLPELKNRHSEKNVMALPRLKKVVISMGLGEALKDKNALQYIEMSKMLVNRGMDADIDTGLRLEIYGWALCFAHEDRQKMMSAFLSKSKK